MVTYPAPLERDVDQILLLRNVEIFAPKKTKDKNICQPKIMKIFRNISLV
jgi:hypothetical protein